VGALGAHALAVAAPVGDERAVAEKVGVAR